MFVWCRRTRYVRIVFAGGRVTFCFAGMASGSGLASGSLGCGWLVSSTVASTASAMGDEMVLGYLWSIQCLLGNVLGCAFVGHVHMFEGLMVILLLFAGKLVL